MKIYFTCLFFLINSIVFSQGIKFFEGSLDAVKAEASKQNKFIFVDCYTTWCGPCKWLAKYVFTNAHIGNFYNQNFVNYTLDMEKGEGKEFAKKYGIHAYPTLLFIDFKGNVQHRYVGACDTISFLAIGKQALDTNNNFGSLLRRYQRGDRTPDFLAKYALTCAAVYYPYDVQEYFATQPDSALFKEINIQILERYTPSIYSREFKYVIKNFDQFVINYSFERIYAYITNSIVKYLYASSTQKDFSAEKEIEKFLSSFIFPYSPYWKAAFLMEYNGYYKVKRYTESIQYAKQFLQQAILSTPYHQQSFIVSTESLKNKISDEFLLKEFTAFLNNYLNKIETYNNSTLLLNVLNISIKAKNKEMAEKVKLLFKNVALNDQQQKEYEQLIKQLQTL
ncbi:MAG: thioredoxin family protein [Bacteroidales bacterium]|nr:thioredoxin family protein [Bacteroidales bacterium]